MAPAYQEIDASDGKHNGEKNQCCCGGVGRIASGVAVEHIIDVAHDRIHAGRVQICSEQGIARKAFEPTAVKALQSKQWTGNIRQLRNVVERLIILAGAKITKEDVEAYA